MRRTLDVILLLFSAVSCIKPAIVVTVLSIEGDESITLEFRPQLAPDFSPQYLPHLAYLRDQVSEFCAQLRTISSDQCKEGVLSEVLAQHQSTRVPSYLEPERVLASFSRELVDEACALDHMPPDCAAAALSAIRSVKIMNMAEKMEEIKSHIDDNKLIQVSPNWRDSIEGSIILFHNKIDLFQTLADDIRVETICEVGFNLGHSAANWFSANPKASVLAFDISRTAYTAAAINAMSVVFPGRVVSLIEGDSRYSVPHFTELLRRHSRDSTVGVQCNIILIDGAHDYDGALLDLLNFAPLANKTFHRVIIDDASMQPVRSAIHSAAATGRLRMLEERETPSTLCNIASKVLDGPFKGSYIFREMTPEENCSVVGVDVAEMDSVIIAEYM